MCVTVAALIYKLSLHFVFQVKVTEIVDVTDADSSIVLSPEECENNIQLEFDDDEWLSQHVMQTEGQYCSDITKLTVLPIVMVPSWVCDMFLNRLRYNASGRSLLLFFTAVLFVPLHPFIIISVL